MVALEAKRNTTFDNIKLLENKILSVQSLTKAIQRQYEAGNMSLEKVLNAQLKELDIASQLATYISQHITLSAEFNSHILGDDHENL